MKHIYRTLSIFLITIFMFACASNKPQYKTRQGKVKLRYYNMIQYDRQSNYKDWKKKNKFKKIKRQYRKQLKDDNKPKCR